MYNIVSDTRNKELTAPVNDFHWNQTSVGPLVQG